MKFTGTPLAHVKAGPPAGWMPRWSAKKERQLARRKARFEHAEQERMRKAAPPPAEQVTLPQPFWRRALDRVRRFFSRRRA
jgi:hypothetical protein